MATSFDGHLDVTIADARISRPQSSSRQDTYCVVTLGSAGLKNLMEGESFGKEKFQTKVHNGGGQRPAWDETHSLSLKNMKLDSYLRVKLYDKDTIKDTFLGETQVTLEELLRYDKGEVEYFPLYKKEGSSQTIGQIGVAVTFNCTEIPHADIKSQYRGQSQAPNVSTKGQMEQGHPLPHNTSGDIASKGRIDQGHQSRNIGQKSQYGSTDVSKGQIEQGHPLPHTGTSGDL